MPAKDVLKLAKERGAKIVDHWPVFVQ